MLGVLLVGILFKGFARKGLLGWVYLVDLLGGFCCVVGFALSDS